MRNRPFLGSAASIFRLITDGYRYLAARQSIVLQHLVRQGNLLKSEGLSETRIDLAVDNHLVKGESFFAVRKMRALNPLLPHPQVADVEIGHITAGCTTGDYHSVRVAHP